MYNYFFPVRKDGKFECQRIYTLDTFPWRKIPRELVSERGKKKPVLYYSDFASFDIESTTIHQGDKHTGFMYVWQMCVCGYTVGGRTWEEWIDFIKKLDRVLKLESHKRFVIYVHNLSFEFQFLYRFLVKHFCVPDVFAVNTRKVLKCTCGGIEFRCSYKLSNQSLEKACINEYGCPYLKAVGDLDYSVYRDYLTPFTDRELTYIFSDAIALYWYVKAKLENEGDTIATIPLTSTAFVRRECRKACKKDREYMKAYLKQGMTPAVYKMLKDAGRGGDTAANWRYAGRKIADVDSYDAVSSYPYQQCTQKFPSRKFYPYGKVCTYEELEYLCSSKAVLFVAAFNGLKCKADSVCAYLPFSKATSYSGKVTQANGRVLKAEAISYTFTDIDWEIVKDTYTWDTIAIGDVYYTKYDYLPEALVNCIKKYFFDKCKLGYDRDNAELNDDMEAFNLLAYQYFKSKNRLNGIFGMSYTDPVRDTYDFNPDRVKDGKPEIWKKDTADPDTELPRELAKDNSFLVYAWGVWTTAHARRHLHVLRKCTGKGTIYWDTDSSKAFDVDHSAIERVNEGIRKLCEDRGAYCDVGGKRYYMGVFDCETVRGKYRSFKTLGAKKYAYVDHKGELHLTVSGVGKSRSPHKPDGARELGTIDNFKPGFVFREAGGITLYYNDDPISTLEVNGHKFTTAANVGSENSTYKIGVTGEYAEILGINLY